MSTDEMIQVVLDAQRALRDAEQARDDAAAMLRHATQEALAAGAGAAAIAEAAGVNRQRVYKWASKDYR